MQQPIRETSNIVYYISLKNKNFLLEVDCIDPPPSLGNARAAPLDGAD